MPIKKRYSEFVRKGPNGSLEVRTPAACTRWTNEFRLRIVRDYLSPNCMVERREYERRFDQSAIYKVMGFKLQFRQPTQDIEKWPSRIIILSNEIVNLTTRRVMVLKHDEASYRMLMVYSFLTNTVIGGVPSYRTYDWQP